MRITQINSVKYAERCLSYSSDTRLLKCIAIPHDGHSIHCDHVYHAIHSALTKVMGR